MKSAKVPIEQIGDLDTSRLIKIITDLLVLFMKYTPNQAETAVAGFLSDGTFPVDADWLHHEGAWRSALAIHFLQTLQGPPSTLWDWVSCYEDTEESRAALEYFRDHYFR